MKALSLRSRAVYSFSMLALAAAIASGQDDLGTEIAQQADASYEIANNLWMLIATALVFIMHLGFACLETGLTRAKNTVNILFKNVTIVGIGILTYALVGFSLMYPGEEFAGAWFGFGGLGIAPPDDYNPATYANGNYTYWADFLFQGMFAATAATIVSGAVAERIKLGPFLIFSAIYVALIYP
ncbi:unnamed protein product, partial [Laminaria digitata]